MSPNPTTTSRPTKGLADCFEMTSPTSKNPGQRFKQAGVFSGQPHGDAQVVRHAVVGDRAHNHPLLQQPVIHGRCVLPYIQRNEIALGRNPAQAQRPETLLLLLHTGLVQTPALCQILHIA